MEGDGKRPTSAKIGGVNGGVNMGKLSAVAIKYAPPGRLHDGDGLFLDRTATGGRWTYRYRWLGRRRDMGLGSYPSVSLSDARKSRDAWRAVLNDDKDPIEVRTEQRAEQKARRDQQDPTFREMTETAFASLQPTLRGGGKNGRWLSPIEKHVLPKIGSRRASDLSADDFETVLRPIWHDKQPTAKKVVNRCRIILRKAKLKRKPVDPDIVDQAVEALGEVIHTETPIPATPWQDIPALYQRLPDTVGGQCLRFMILTVVRLNGCAGAHANEFDGNVWTVPADRVKGREAKAEAFRLPLSFAAIDLIAAQAEFFTDHLFPGNTGRPITSRALEKCLNELGEAGRPHGFRTSFRTWVQDTSQDPGAWEVAETALGHKIGGRVERSYARSDMLDRRAPLMEAWARFVTGQETANVVPFTR